MNTTLLIVMGVSGCGKSTIARKLAAIYDLNFIEADDFHSEQAIRHMANERPLTDSMRQPWVDQIKHSLKINAQCNRNTVLAFSGLRYAHRESCRYIFPNTLFIHLKASHKTIQERINQRQNHFMPASLLDSQFTALEPNKDEPDMLEMDATGSIELILENARYHIKHHLDNHLTVQNHEKN